MTEPDPDLLALVPTDPLAMATNCLQSVRRSAARMAAGAAAIADEDSTGRLARAHQTSRMGACLALISIAQDTRRAVDLLETWLAATDPPVQVPPLDPA